MKKFLEFIETLNANLYENLTRRLIHEKIPCALFAANQINPFYLNIANQFQNSGINLRYIVTADDDVSQKPPENLQFVNINALNSLGNSKPRFIFTTLDVGAVIMTHRFIEMGIEPVAIEMSGSTRKIADFHISHLRDIFEVYNSFIDEESRDSYLGFILSKVTKRLSYCRFEKSDQYVLHGFIPEPNEIVIDGGSCDGKTAAMFADFGCKVIAFEMDHENFKLASKLAEEKNFTVENLGLADESREVSYKHDPKNIGGSFVDAANRLNSDTKTQLISLDSYVREKNLPRIDFIKLDTEGSELSILKGAVNSIMRFKPKLAISAYHKLEDVFTLQQFLKSIRPDYEFAFRHFESSYDYVPFVFTERILQICEKLNIPRKFPGFGESILFAR